MVRRTLVAATALALIAGCTNWPGPHRPASVDERGYVAAARHAWAAAGRGEAVCDGRLERVIIVTPADIQAACARAPDAPRVSACYYGVNPTVFEPVHVAIHLDPALDGAGRRNGIVHEALHAIRACVSQRLLEENAAPAWVAEGSDLPDRMHTDAALWGPIQNDALRRADPPLHGTY